MTLDENWFSEIYPDQGSAFSLKIKQKLCEEQTPYQKITIYETQSFGNLMAIDGYIMLSSKDNFFYHEMMSHPVLFTHSNPKNIAIIGGGDCGTLKEVLKHKTIEKVIQVDIDERVTRLSEQYFPELCTANNDPRAEFFFGDGIAWIKEQKNVFDIIIVDSTDPVGPAEGLFKQAFFEDCYNALTKEGLVIQQSGSPLYSFDTEIKPMQENLRKANFMDVLTLHYPQPVYPSGWWSATIGAKNTLISHFREEAIEEMEFKTRYYNLGIHKGALAAPAFFYENL